MARSFFFLVVFAIMLPPVFSQTAEPPPPAPKALVKLDAHHTHESAEGGFKINFPAKPSAQKSLQNSSFGKSEVNVAFLSTGLADYAVVYLDFPTVMEDKYDLNIRFDALRDAQTKALGNAKVMTDSEFFFGSNYGRENVYETASRTYSARTVVAGPRMFMISVETRGKLSTQTKIVSERNRSLIDKFFNSFQITKTAEAKEAAVSLPDDFGVEVVDRQFKSKFLGVSMTMPENWISLDRPTIDMLMGLGADEVKKTDQALAERISDAQNARTLAIFSKGDPNKGRTDGLIFVIAEKAPYPSFLPLAVANTYTKLYLEPKEKILQSPVEVKVNGMNAAFLETMDMDIEPKMTKRMYFFNRKGVSLQILFMYSAQTDQATMMAVLKTLAPI